MEIKTRKLQMSQIFDEHGFVVPVTELKVLSEIKDEELVATKGKSVAVRGVSKGKGYTGVMKKWGFSGAAKTHGHKNRTRHPGSIGTQGQDRVVPFKKMAGRSGSKTVFIKGLKIVAVESNFIKVSGPVPGHKGGIVEVTVL